MDYITLDGIGDRTAFDIEDLYQFVIKELLDNAIDELEKKYAVTTLGSNDVPQIMVYISTDYKKTSSSDGTNYKYLKLKVQNSAVMTSTISEGYTVRQLHRYALEVTYSPNTLFSDENTVSAIHLDP
jgi:hypothetical protein